MLSRGNRVEGNVCAVSVFARSRNVCACRADSRGSVNHEPGQISR